MRNELSHSVGRGGQGTPPRFSAPVVKCAEVAAVAAKGARGVSAFQTSNCGLPFQRPTGPPRTPADRFYAFQHQLAVFCGNLVVDQALQCNRPSELTTVALQSRGKASRFRIILLLVSWVPDHRITDKSTIQRVESCQVSQPVQSLPFPRVWADLRPEFGSFREAQSLSAFHFRTLRPESAPKSPRKH